ncbi:MAG: lipopolysaccharide biosynthesis protein [Acidimicrobiia bacterium]
MTIDDELRPPAGGFRAPGTGLMVFGSLLAALGAYLFQIVGGRALGAEGFAPVSVLWTMFFILATVVLVPVEQHITREAASGRKVMTFHGLLPSLVAVSLVAVVGVLFVLFTLDDVFLGDPTFVLVTFVLFVSYGLYEMGRGLLTGHRRFGLVGWAMIGESLGRLGLALAFLSLASTAISLGWAMAFGAFTVLGTRFWRFDHETSTGSTSGAGRFLGGYVVGSAASQTLLGGAPLAVLALGGGPELISIAFLTFTLYRAPLTLTYLLQGRLLPYLVRLVETGDRSQADRLISRFLAIGAGLCLAGALTGYLAGADVVQLLLGAEFRPTPVVAALVAGGVVAAVTTQVVGQFLVAEGRTSALTAVWSLGLAVAVLVLVVSSLEPLTRVALAFAVGESVALTAMWRMSRYPGQELSPHDR